MAQHFMENNLTKRKKAVITHSTEKFIVFKSDWG